MKDETKIICPSDILHDFLKDFIEDEGIIHDEWYCVSCTNGHLYIGHRRMPIESKCNWDRNFSFSKLKQLRKLLKRLPSQPIVLFWGDDMIEIYSVEL